VFRRERGGAANLAVFEMWENESEMPGPWFSGLLPALHRGRPLWRTLFGRPLIFAGRMPLRLKPATNLFGELQNALEGGVRFFGGEPIWGKVSELLRVEHVDLRMSARWGMPRAQSGESV